MRFLSIPTAFLALLCAAGSLLPQVEGEDVQASQLMTNALQRHVENGLVDYGGMVWDKDYQRYLKWLENADVESFNSTEREVAFWINAYNALAIRGVLRNSQIIDRSSSERMDSRALAEELQRKKQGKETSAAAAIKAIKSVLDVADFFNKQQHRVAGKKYTLDQIEKEILIPMVKDPKLHFVLVCAARSCPALTAEAFTAGNLETKMEEVTRQFLNNSEKNRLDREKRIFYLSQIFNWYRDDFGRNEQDLVEFIKPYLNQDVRDFLAANQVKVKYLEYDWRLNIQ